MGGFRCVFFCLFAHRGPWGGGRGGGLSRDGLCLTHRWGFLGFGWVLYKQVWEDRLIGFDTHSIYITPLDGNA